MALEMMFLCVFIPIKNIERVYPGGFEGYLKYLSDSKKLRGINKYDQLLFRDGAMSPDDIDQICGFWENLGLNLIKEENGQQKWDDLCVIDMIGGPTRPCDWIVVEQNYVYMKGYPKGEVIPVVDPTRVKTDSKQKYDQNDIVSVKLY